MLQRNISRQAILSAGIFVAIVLSGCAADQGLSGPVPARVSDSGEAVLSPFAAFFSGGKSEFRQPDTSLPARVAKLRRKARAIQGPVLSNAERRRLMAALARHSS